MRTRFFHLIQITDAEVEEALTRGTSRPNVEAVIAEIVLPARDPEEMAQAQALADELQRTATSVGAFAEAAREYSVSPTAPNGGRLPRAMPLQELPAPIRAQVTNLAPGQITNPLVAPNAIAIFQLVSLRDLGVTQVSDVEVQYATYLIPGGQGEDARAEAARVIGKVDTCDNLYTVNKGKAPERLTVTTQPMASVPRDIALELARLDRNEISTGMTRGENMVLVMLCSRAPIREETPDPSVVRNALANERLGLLGDSYLAELRENALIRYP
ncbi:peptidylprolyl isomerase [Tropicimonas sp.]|uniref:peptidylprolyl isomerase n=1 Tax=Tropicimonas sp. TaxID=2067044 RepID=UPI003A83DA5C